MIFPKEKPKSGSESGLARLAKPKTLLIGVSLLVVGLAVMMFGLLSGDSDDSGQTTNQPLPVNTDDQLLPIDSANPPAVGFEDRNHQRHLDVGKVAGIIRQAIADGEPPTTWGDIADQLAAAGLDLYDQAQISSHAPDWVESAKPSDFIDFALAAAQNPVPRLSELMATIDGDQVLVFSTAACNYDNNAVEVGGPNDLAVAYRLEGETDIICVDI